MRTLPFCARFIAYTAVLVITAALLIELYFFPSPIWRPDRLAGDTANRAKVIKPDAIAPVARVGRARYAALRGSG